MARGLEAAGADFLVIPLQHGTCLPSTIAAGVKVPVLDVVQLAIATLKGHERKPQRIGMLASPAVRLMGLLEKRFAEAGLTTVFADAETEAHLLEIIRAVKAGHVTPSHQRTYEAMRIAWRGWRRCLPCPLHRALAAEACRSRRSRSSIPSISW